MTTMDHGLARRMWHQLEPGQSILGIAAVPFPAPRS
jgi:hypothetical protein